MRTVCSAWRAALGSDYRGGFSPSQLPDKDFRNSSVVGQSKPGKISLRASVFRARGASVPLRKGGVRDRHYPLGQSILSRDQRSQPDMTEAQSRGRSQEQVDGNGVLE